MVKLFLLLILAHLIAEFVVQTTYMNENKKRCGYSLYSKGLLYHCMHHLVFMFILLLILLEWNWIYIPVVIMISISHYFIDLAKIKGEAFFTGKHREEKHWFRHLLKKKIPILF